VALLAVWMLVHDRPRAKRKLALFGEAVAGFLLDLLDQGLCLLLAFSG
jgi:hypothetical protein